ncbi:hypothetical protein LCGC14_0629250 [marine sediment metagenome]|uniref:Uncharacterized protein n=1 Tax=marine sediment metagenome TaxID=412755 RepID=A0A0F9R2A9_9ZZZZ
MIKKQLFLLVIILTIYAPAELTRAIIVYTSMEWQYIFEIAFIWVLYVAGVILAGVLIWRTNGGEKRPGTFQESKEP